MKEVKGKDKTIALAYIKHRFPIGTEVWDICHPNWPYTIKKYSVFEIISDIDEYPNQKEEDQRYTFTVRDPGKKSMSYTLNEMEKRWVEYFYNTRINTQPGIQDKTREELFNKKNITQE